MEAALQIDNVRYHMELMSKSIVWLINHHFQGTNLELMGTHTILLGGITQIFHGVTPTTNPILLTSQIPPPQNAQHTQAASSSPRPYQPSHQRNFQPNSYQPFPDPSCQNQQQRPPLYYANSCQPMYHDQYALRENLGEEGWKKEVEYLRRELDRKTKEHKRDYKNLKASTRNLEIQLGQWVRLNNDKPIGAFPSDTIPIPEEQCNAITLRSGKELVEFKEKKNVEVGSKEQRSKVIENEKEVVDDEAKKEQKNEIKVSKKKHVEEPLKTDPSIKVPYP
ncbi:hypothetical protein ACH5RR_037308 [Cinchona calisaya]|uniref:Uncharacterized protein n=1 Tax=Cinchona calisaya TaxID=153742 RepID=A0ABD2Y5S9_9GENT